MFNGSKVAVVVPAFNEADKIAATVRSVPGWVDQLLVVDDASTDGTGGAALRTDRPGLELLTHAANRGVGAAIATGYRRALERGAEIVAVMAGDGQMDPADLPALLAEVAEGRADYAKGNRFAGSEWRAAMPLPRIAGNVVLSLLTRISSGYWGLFDSQCGYTAISRTAIEAVGPETLFPRYGYPNDLLARLQAIGARVVDVPVRAVYGPRWRSGISLRAALRVLGVIARSFFWRRRVRRTLTRGDRTVSLPPWSAAS